MKKYFVPFLFFTIAGWAQTSKPPIQFRSAFVFSPFALVGPDFTFMPGVEYRLHPKTTLQADLGLVLGSAYVGSNNNSDVSTKAMGFMIRPSVKFYLNERNTFYIQPQVFYKMVTHHLSDWVDKAVVNGVGSYQEFEDFRYRRSIYGFNTVVGALVPLSKKSRSYFDFYLGLGARNKDAWVVGEPESNYDGQGSFGRTRNTDHGTFPSVPVGVKLVFVID